MRSHMTSVLHNSGVAGCDGPDTVVDAVQRNPHVPAPLVDLGGEHVQIGGITDDRAQYQAYLCD